MRIVHLVVAVVLVTAAVWVYKIKFEATVEAERVAKLRIEIRREHDAAAALRAEAARLESPSRIQDIAQRHLSLRLVDPTQIDTFENLPARPSEPAAPGDPIGDMLVKAPEATATGSVRPGSKP